MNLTIGLLADAILLAIILWKLISGVRSGLVRMLCGLVSLGGGIAAGSLLRSMLADTVSANWLTPAIDRVLEKAKDNLGLPDLLENLERILENAQLPAFLKLNVADQVRQMQVNGATAVTNAAEIIAQRLAGWILFFLGLVIAALLLRAMG